MLRRHTGLAVTASALQPPWSRRCRRSLILGGRKGRELSEGPAPLASGGGGVVGVEAFLGGGGAGGGGGAAGGGGGGGGGGAMASLNSPGLAWPG